MTSLDTLPADQRAVLELVLRRGRTYDEIADLLAIDRAAVRQRALGALDALGPPQTRVPAERRALITDYLLGQLPSRVADDTRMRLSESAAERAWARVIASELGSIGGRELPEIPVNGGRRDVTEREQPDREERTRIRERAARASRESEPTTATSPASPRDGPRRPSGGRPGRPSSRRGGAILLALAGAGILAVIIILIAGGGGAGKHHRTASTAARSSTSKTGTSSTASRLVAQINLFPPTPAASKTRGIAEVLKQGATTGIVIVAQNVTPNSKHNAYAVWLYNSPTDSHILGFVNPGVSSSGQLRTAGALPANASHYKQLLVTLETQGNPKTPGTIVLQGTLTGV